MADKGIIYMNINVLSKYIILFLFAVLVVLSVLLAVYSADNKALHKANAVLKEQVSLRDAAINEIDKNIYALKQQVIEAEQICNERIQARKDVVDFLHINPPNFAQSSKGVSTPPAFYTGVIDDEKSNIAVNHINKYWGMFFTHAGGS